MKKIICFLWIGLCLFCFNLENVDAKHTQMIVNNVVKREELILSSDKYVIDEDNFTIDVGGDSDKQIKANLNINDNTVDIVINGDKLSLVSDGEVIREYVIKRVDNPTTGILALFVTFITMIASVFVVVASRQNIVRNKI